MSEVIDSYNLVWSSPVCQQEIRNEFLFEINNFLFSVIDSDPVVVNFLLSKLGESLLIDFEGDSELKLGMGVNSDKVFPVTFETAESEVTIDFSLS